MRCLTLNEGSSSVKLALFALESPLIGEPQPALVEGEAVWLADRVWITMKSVHGVWQRDLPADSTRPEAALAMMKALWQSDAAVVSGSQPIEAVCHRVVHGGPDYRAATRATPAVRGAIARFAPFAPQHNPACLAMMAMVESFLGDVPQIACFDTAFHRTLPPEAAIFPGPYAWHEQGLRRYGFHGLSHEYASRRAAVLLGRESDTLDLVTCHLGNGCSLAAVRHGQSVETTMSLTPLDGVMMATRPGALDPGLLLYLMREGGATYDQLTDSLNHDSGLLGISGLSGDMRAIVTAMDGGHERARLAYDLYVHHLRAGIGAMLAALGRVDAIVFTGGVGEHSPRVRASALATLGFVGARIDTVANDGATEDRDISAADSVVRVVVVGSREDWAMARAAWQVMHQM